MEEGEGVKLYGSRCSGFCIMVEMALKLKGLSYEYVEEDLSNKSAALLRLNPVHQKVPVLLHAGEPIAESLIILHYIDETWTHPPPLLPDAPLRRARVRFWVDFFFHTLIPASSKVLALQGVELTRALEELRETVKTMDAGLRRDLPDGPFFGGAAPGLLDAVFTSSCVGVPVTGEVLGVNVVDEEAAPFITSRLAAIAELDAAKAVLPSRDAYFEFATKVRQRLIAAASP